MNDADERRVNMLQERVDRILSGSVEVEYRTEERHFAPFSVEDRREASDLAGTWIALAEEQGGIDGLEAAVFAIGESLGQYRPGAVQHATLLFLTHHRFARENLIVRSLEDRQPGLVTPSQQYAGGVG
jgi:hypothetical protein